MSALLLDAIPSLWRASDLGRSAAPVCPSGFAALDAELPGGGWPCGQLTEVLQPEAGWREWRLLAPCLARLSQQGSVVLVGPPLVPHLPALAWQANLAVFLLAACAVLGLVLRWWLARLDGLHLIPPVWETATDQEIVQLAEMAHLYPEVARLLRAAIARNLKANAPTRNQRETTQKG